MLKTCLLPWRFSYNITLNGFHPLYEYLTEISSDELSLIDIDHIKMRDILNDRKSSNIFLQKGLSCADKMPAYLRRYIKDSKYRTIEMGINAFSSADIELVHTAPLASMARPFIFHLENFHSIFKPYNYKDRSSSQIVEGIKYLLESELCLQIVSHFKITLEEISIFFNSNIIDSKLKYLDIGYLNDKMQNISDYLDINDEINLLAVNSHHQNFDNFEARGAKINFELFKELKIKYPLKRIKFFWKSKRPSADFLASLLEGWPKRNIEYYANQIIWIDRYLSYNETNKLFGKCHFYLQLSNCMHTHALLTAAHSRCVPIASEINHHKKYASRLDLNLVPGFEECWFEENGILYPFETPSINSREAAKSACNLISEYVEGRHHYRPNLAVFSSKRNAGELLSLIKASMKCTQNKNELLINDKKISIPVEQITRQFFNHPINPILIGSTFECRSANKDNITKAENLHTLYYQSSCYLHQDFRGEGWEQLNKDAKYQELSSPYWKYESKDKHIIKNAGDMLSVLSIRTLSPEVQKFQNNDEFKASYKSFLESRKMLKNYGATRKQIKVFDHCHKFNIIKLFHIYVPWEKAKGAFPSEKFILEYPKFKIHLTMDSAIRSIGLMQP